MEVGRMIGTNKNDQHLGIRLTRKKFNLYSKVFWVIALSFTTDFTVNPVTLICSLLCRKKVFPLDIFLITYCLACVVINTGYEGNMKSHLSAIVLPPPITTLQEFADFGVYKDIIYLAPMIEQVYYLFSIIPAMNRVPDEHHMRSISTSLTEYFYESLDGHALIGSRTLFKIKIVQQLTNQHGITKVQVSWDFYQRWLAKGLGQEYLLSFCFPFLLLLSAVEDRFYQVFGREKMLIKSIFWQNWL